MDLARNSFELCPRYTAKIRNSNFRQKYGRREAPSVLHSPHKILILQGFATRSVENLGGVWVWREFSPIICKQSLKLCKQNPSVRFSFKPPRAPRVAHQRFWK
ncbi:hypothetical protein A3E03_01300 [Candidatus Nomurabacteria bacterium RIFCSPHIGHO2_12_FULL_40_64]|nr:MAG: hypothetical protein A3E03_01300 [Candidatus Nomurabacteria bacterium RIFCSPHIGHO2_12_FULL_40_64]